MEDIEITRLKNRYSTASSEHSRLSKLEEETSYPVITNGGVYTHRDPEFHAKVMSAKKEAEMLEKEYNKAIRYRDAEIRMNTRAAERVEQAKEYRLMNKKEELQRKTSAFNAAKQRWQYKNFLYKLFHYKNRPQVYEDTYQYETKENLNNLYR